jgi:hypothetical protein
MGYGSRLVDQGHSLIKHGDTGQHDEVRPRHQHPVHSDALQHHIDSQWFCRRIRLLRQGFLCVARTLWPRPPPQSLRLLVPPLGAKISRERRDQLGIGEDQDEYDLDVALNQNTDPLITKVIAGSLIVAILAGLVFGVVIPVTTDYGEGICNPLLSAGRC